MEFFNLREKNFLLFIKAHGDSYNLFKTGNEGVKEFEGICMGTTLVDPDIRSQGVQPLKEYLLWLAAGKDFLETLNLISKSLKITLGNLPIDTEDNRLQIGEEGAGIRHSPGRRLHFICVDLAMGCCCDCFPPFADLFLQNLEFSYIFEQ